MKNYLKIVADRLFTVWLKTLEMLFIICVIAGILTIAFTFPIWVLLWVFTGVNVFQKLVELGD